MYHTASTSPINNKNKKSSITHHSVDHRNVRATMDDSSPSFDEATTTKQMASKRPFRETQGSPDRSDGPSLKRIRQIQTFSIDYDDDDDDDDETIVAPIPAKGADSAEGNTNNDDDLHQYFSSKTFQFDSWEDIFATSTNATAADGRSNNTTTTTTTTCDGPKLCFVVGDDNNLSAPTNLMKTRPRMGSQPQLLFRSSSPLDRTSSKTGETTRTTHHAIIDGKEALTSLQQPPPFPAGVLITPNDDENNETPVAELPSWDLLLGTTLCMDSADANPNVSSAGVSLRPNPATLEEEKDSGKLSAYMPPTRSPVGPVQEPSSFVQGTTTAAEKYSPRLQGLPLPDSMKPILRILLHLEEDYHHDEDLVRDSFAIVQTCYDKASYGEDINGSIFESLVENLGRRVDLAAVFQAAPTLEASPNLNAYFGGDDDYARTTKPKEQRKGKTFFPTLLQLAVAYGFHSARSSAAADGMKQGGVKDYNAEGDDIEEIVCNGAKAVGAMSADEKIAFWKLVAQTTSNNKGTK
jgi:hypothetical protein